MSYSDTLYSLLLFGEVIRENHSSDVSALYVNMKRAFKYPKLTPINIQSFLHSVHCIKRFFICDSDVSITETIEQKSQTV